MANSNINNAANLQNSNALAQQNAYQNAQNAAIGGTQGATQTALENKNSTMNAVTSGLGAAAGLAGSILSDERLKHYKECSKKVVMRTPSKIQSLKIDVEGMKR
jgi:hypothetical protein